MTGIYPSSNGGYQRIAPAENRQGYSTAVAWRKYSPALGAVSSDGPDGYWLRQKLKQTCSVPSSPFPTSQCQTHTVWRYFNKRSSSRFLPRLAKPDHAGLSVQLPCQRAFLRRCRDRLRAVMQESARAATGSTSFVMSLCIHAVARNLPTEVSSCVATLLHAANRGDSAIG